MQWASHALSAYAVLCVVAGATFVAAGRERARRRLRRLVYTALDNAYYNGAFEPGEYLDGFSAHDIAIDLMCYDAGVEEWLPQEIEPHVKAWLRERGDYGHRGI